MNTIVDVGGDTAIDGSSIASSCCCCCSPGATLSHRRSRVDQERFKGVSSAYRQMPSGPSEVRR